MRFPRSLYLSLGVIFLLLFILRPAIPYYALPLVPIALAALLYEFVGGTLVGLAALAGVGALIALEHARLYTLEQEQARQLQAISAAGKEIASRLSLEATLQLVMEKASETLPMDAGALLQINPDTRAFHVIVSENISSDHTREISIPINTGVPGWVVNHRQFLVIPDTAGDPRVHPAIIEDGVLSVLSLPLIAREKMSGVLNLYNKTERNVFGQDAIQLAQVFADQAAIAIENASLMDELRQGAAELEARIESRTRQLRESQAQVIQSEKLAAVGRLAASVAHEVNNPLQAITLQLQLIREENMTEEVCNRLDIVGQEMQRISEIVGHLLDFQRPTTGQKDFQNIPALLDSILLLVSKQLQKQGVTVELERSPNLAKVSGNGGQIKQVFLNLVLNAIDAMPNGGVLSIHTFQETGSVKVSFADNGIGMSPQVLSQLFEPFFSTKPEGSGLGLAVSHDIITRHGGALSVASQPGKGSTFVVSLPVPAGKTEEEPA